MQCAHCRQSHIIYIGMVYMTHIGVSVHSLNGQLSVRKSFYLFFLFALCSRYFAFCMAEPEPCEPVIYFFFFALVFTLPSSFDCSPPRPKLMPFCRIKSKSSIVCCLVVLLLGRFVAWLFVVVDKWLLSEITSQQCEIQMVMWWHC